MCGIAGWVESPRQAWEPQHRDHLQHSMNRALASRGPDASGCEVAPHARLVHRRLRVIDVSTAADQPMTDSSGKVALVFNGEIYNFRELRAELEKLGHRFQTQSDTEVILQGYLKWGQGVVDRLNGMFAVVIMDHRDSKTTRFVLARDRYGIKPLFFALRQQGAFHELVFGSTLRCFQEVPWVSKETEASALFWYLKHSHFPHPWTAFRGVKQLEPGTVMTLTRKEQGDEVEVRSLDFSMQKFEFLDPQLSLGRVLERVIERQLISDVPVGCFLSGGVDSSLILREASRKNSDLIAFSVDYDETVYSEFEQAQATARALGVPCRRVKIHTQDFLEMISQIPQYLDQPIADPTLIPSLILSREAKKEVTVVLSGDGGDEMFFGYRYQEVLWRLRWLRNCPAQFRVPLLKAIVSILKHVPSERAWQAIKAAEVLQFTDDSDWLQRMIGTFGPVSYPRIARLISKPDFERSRPLSPLEARWDAFRDLDWEQKIEQVFRNTFLCDTVLAKSDRAGMAFGLEIRVPFLDEEMVRYADSIPFHQKFRNGTTKWALRQEATRGLPVEVARREKRGFSVPLKDWMKGTERASFLKWIEATLDAVPQFNRDEVKQLWKEHANGHANHSHLLWSIISFGQWRIHL